jgi:hypothetical protein
MILRSGRALRRNLELDDPDGECPICLNVPQPEQLQVIGVAMVGAAICDHAQCCRNCLQQMTPANLQQMLSHPMCTCGQLAAVNVL